jgi:hypothetical protein
MSQFGPNGSAKPAGCSRARCESYTASRICFDNVPARTVRRACYGAIVLLGLICVAAIASVLPFATQDGPVHVTFGNLLALDREAHPLLFEHYRTNDALNPNSTVYILVAALLKVFSPAVAESLVQVLGTLGVVASAWFALRQVSVQKDATWLTLLVFPLALSRLFFFGTYNFCFSVAAFLLALGSFLRLEARVTLWRALTVVAALYFAFFAHGAGFVAAGLAVAALALTQAVRALRAGVPWRTVARVQGINLLVLASPLPLVVLSLGGNADAPIAYAMALDRRLVDLALLDPLRVHPGLGKELATFLLNPLLFGGVAALAIHLWRGRRQPSPPDQGSGAAGALAVFAAMLTLALTFPDTFGGGWIHFQRMALFPFLGGLFCLAYYPFSTRAQAAIASVATIVTVVLLADAVTAQREIARQSRPLADVNRIVGSHCSVLPLVLSLKPLDERDRPIDIAYDPFLHVGTRLEYSGDRVSLFNYQARTPLYPVRFQERHDTQDLIFHWRPMQRSVGIRTVDIERFEASSGMPVDYILQWGPLSAAAPELRLQVVQAEQGAERVYESPDRRVTLFRRRTAGRSRCAGPPSAGG